MEIFSPEVVNLFAARRTTQDRGVTSLAPEPTFFSVYLFFSIWIMLEANKFLINKVVFFLVLINVAGIFLLAKSLMIGLFVVVSVCFMIWYQLKPFMFVLRGFVWIFILLFGVFFISLIDWNLFISSRIVKVVIRFLENPSLIDMMLDDASINQRVEAVVMSLHGSLYHYLLPAGFDTFTMTRDRITVLYDDFFWYPTSSNKILSWMGSVVYELGIFGIVMLIAFVIISYQGHHISRLSLTLLGIILLSAVPLAFPLVPMLLALFLVNKRSMRQF